MNRSLTRSTKIESIAIGRAAMLVATVLALFVTLSPAAKAGDRPFFSGSVQEEGNAPAQSLPQLVKNVGIDQHLGAKVSLDLPVRDEAGRWTTLGSYFGSTPVILVMAYYSCPHLCTMVMNGVFSGMKPLSFEPGKDYQIVSVSIDPNETSALALKKKQAYLDNFRETQYPNAFHFLTADSATIATLTKEVGFRYQYDSVDHQFAHAAGIMLLTPQGTISRYFYGVEFAPNDLKFGIMDASGGKVGSLADKLLLYCCQYDPLTTKYGFVVARALKIGGTLILLIMGAMFLWFRRYNRKMKEQRMTDHANFARIGDDAILAGKGLS